MLGGDGREELMSLIKDRDELKFDKKEWLWWIKMFTSFFALYLISIILFLIIKKDIVIVAIMPMVFSAISAIFLGIIVDAAVATKKIPKSIFFFCYITVGLFLYTVPRKKDFFHFDNDVIKAAFVYLAMFFGMLFVVLFRLTLSVFVSMTIDFYTYLYNILKNKNS